MAEYCELIRLKPNLFPKNSAERDSAIKQCTDMENDPVAWWHKGDDK
jgi:hypothetical protein